MASYNYVDTPNVNLTCCICRSPFVEPCTTRTCCHTFCYECIAQAITINRQCPIDRTPLTLHDLVPADPVIRNLVDELLVRCPQEHLGCSYTCQRLLLPIHLSESCSYVEVGCPKKGCNQQVLRKDVQEHQCAEDRSGDAEASASTQEQLRPSSVDDNKTDSTYVPSSGVSGQPASSSVDLASENAMLRLRLSALESVVHMLRSEMFAVKHALGPWYRPEVQPELLAEDQSVADEASSEAFERQLAEELAAQPSGSMTDNPSSPTSRDPTDIASYFPPAEEAVPALPSRQPRHRNTSSVPRIHPSQSSPQGHGPISPVGPSVQTPYANPSQTPLYPSTSYITPGQPSGMPYTTPGTSLPATSPAISIPPLDPTTPLPDTLASLHSSLVTLAGALGALAATRGAESLRTTEELRGLRGAMHGLRMQVHDILTSRTHLAGTSGTSGSGNGDSSDPPTFNLNGPGWFGYGSRPYGTPMHAPPAGPFGIPHAPPPTNIPKL